jgi:chemotaxis receptor (MCP) glutamine deamidase CheD
MEQVLNRQVNSKMVRIGEVLALKKEHESVWTALGSCITVIFHVPQKISLLCHAQMPSKAGYDNNCFNSCSHPCLDKLPEFVDFKYVSCSIEYMINKLVLNHINLKQVHTSLLGGASGIVGLEKNNSIGYLNVIAARKILAKHKIRINREHICGADGITIWYNHGSNSLIVRGHKDNLSFELNDINAQQVLK